MATHSSILAWRIPWMEEPGWLQSMECQTQLRDWAQGADRSSKVVRFPTPRVELRKDAPETPQGWGTTSFTIAHFPMLVFLKILILKDLVSTEPLGSLHLECHHLLWFWCKTGWEENQSKVWAFWLRMGSREKWTLRADNFVLKNHWKK